MSLISRLRAVVAGDDYLNNEYDESNYDANEQGSEISTGSIPPIDSGALAKLSESSSFEFGNGTQGSNVIGMPGISNTATEVYLMKPRNFDEMPNAIQALRERKTVILNLTMMDPDQAQRAVDFVAGGTFAIDGHQERVGESIFLFAPSCITVISVSQEGKATATATGHETTVEPAKIPTSSNNGWSSSATTL